MSDTDHLENLIYDLEDRLKKMEYKLDLILRLLEGLSRA